MVRNFRDLTVYKKAFSLAVEILELTKTFPADEKYELTHQLRRSSRSVCRAIGEGYRKRPYPKHFSGKMSDADMENTETKVSLDLAEGCGYISKEQSAMFRAKLEEVGRMLNHMIASPEKYQRKQ